MAPLLSVNGVSVSYQTQQPGVRVLDNINIEVESGEILGLIGQTGCGKTTLARAILGTLPKQARLNSGTILIDGVDRVRHAGAVRNAISLVPQDTFASFNPLFRIGSQVQDVQRYANPNRKGGWFWRTRRDWEDAALRVFDLVKLAGARDVLRQYPHQLSGGQRQRVMLAMALLRKPKILLVDEPTVSLDASIQAQILDLFRTVAKEQNIGVLLTTHSLGAAWEICDRVTVMHGGRIVESASHDSFFSFPRHPHSRRLLSMASSNSAEPHWPSAISSGSQDVLVGCQFALQCPSAEAICRKTAPRLRNEGGAHSVACHSPWTGEAAFDYD